MPVLTLVFKVLQSLVLAEIGSIVVRWRRIDLSFLTLIRLAVVAMMPAIVLEAVVPTVSSVELEGCLWWMLSGLISLGYMLFAISANRQPATPPQAGGFVAVAGDHRTHLVAAGLAAVLLILGMASVVENFYTDGVARAASADGAAAQREARERLAIASTSPAVEAEIESATPTVTAEEVSGPRDYLAEVHGVLEQGSPARDKWSRRSLEPHEIDQIRGATVRVEAHLGSGSGFVFREPAGERPLVATNYHVVHSKTGRLSREIYVTIHSGTENSTKLTAGLVAANKVNDLALLEVPALPSSTPYLRLAPADDVVETQPVLVAGFPFGQDLDLRGKAPRVTILTGAVSSLRHSQGGILERIQIDADLNPGNSGGPVLDYSGKVVGVAVETILTTNISFVVPVSTVHWLLSGGDEDTQSEATRSQSGVTRTPKIRIAPSKQQSGSGDEPAGVSNLVLSADGDRAWALQPVDRAILEFDLEDMSVRRELPVPGEPITMTSPPNGSRLYVASREEKSTILTIVGLPLAIEKSFQVPRGRAWIAATDRGTLIVQGPGSVLGIDVEREQLVAEGQTTSPRAIALHPDQYRLYIGTSNRFLCVNLDPLVPARGSRRRYEVRSARSRANSGGRVVVSPDGHLLFASRGMVLSLSSNPAEDMEYLRDFPKFHSLAFGRRC